MGEFFILYGKAIAVNLEAQKNKWEGHQGQKYVDKTCITLREDGAEDEEEAEELK